MAANALVAEWFISLSVILIAPLLALKGSSLRCCPQSAGLWGFCCGVFCYSLHEDRTAGEEGIWLEHSWLLPGEVPS